MAQVNGDIPSHPSNSLFVEHLLTYPVVKDGVSTFQNHQLGQKSIQLSDAAYRRLASPVIQYLSKPYQYVSPYLERADQLGDKTLSRVDEQFPAIKKPTDELYADAKNLVLLPYHRGLQGKEHVLGVYSAECKRIGGENLIVYSRALVGTVFAIGGETLDWAGALLNAGKAEAKDALNEKANN
ncbi:probable CAP20 - virulence factor [Cephalotrichum gorgonifer]|uniref:Probable CAP20 - virulence factor n=1 Tax=Cephalotrichum gorgonifer TaxID=2041049 RepID=A0AAE8MVL0_9PEZI|nr:probable CAP20 - virulence factor [Cephalotrichum gorgonifer]